MKKIKIVLASLGFTLFVAGSVAAAEACNAQDTKTNQVGTQSTEQQNMDDFFEKFAAELKSPNVVHLKRHNRLLLLASLHTRAWIAVIIMSIITVFCVLCIVGGITFHEAWLTIFFSILIVFSLLVLGLSISIHLNEQRIKNNPTPYLLFDSIGVKKNNSKNYSLKWKDAEIAVFAERDVPGTFMRVCYYLFSDKFGKELFKVCLPDDLCPIPLDQVKKIFDDCLSKYGSENLKRLEA